ncbi:hypothetical protein BBP40_007596 [Aspergillus hancockii]|nr:hypothetical protein BBP40_007596 [Aspergillus hancockii]
MHDKMRTMLKVLPGGGLDPTAGKARPDQLILPYDPSFLPEYDLPGLGFDVSKLRTPIESISSQESEFLWPRTPDLSQSALSQSPSLRLSFSYHDLIMNDAVGFGSETKVPSSIPRSIDLGGLAATAFNEECGILLQPDFEFDEDGNLIELGGTQRQPTQRQGKPGRQASATLFGDEARDNDLNNDYQSMLVDEDIEDNGKDKDETPTHSIATITKPSDKPESTDELQLTPDKGAATMRQRRRTPKTQTSDERTELRNTELANLNNEYVQNMAKASKQKYQNKLPTQAKKKAAFWVFGQGIGSVGLGLGASRAPHPLQRFSGEELYDALNPTMRKKGRKRSRPHNGESDADSDVRRVRARGEYEEQAGRGELFDDHGVWQEEVEVGRHAPSALRDDHSISSQMPWNITTSVQSSQRGSSAASALRGIANLIDIPSREIPDPLASRGRDPTAAHLAGHGRSHSRLTSASPLAGRGFPFDVDSLTIPGNDEVDVLEDFDLSQYLQTELFGGDNEYAVDDGGANAYGRQLSFEDRVSQSSLDQESLNFLGFLTTRIEDKPEYNGDLVEDGFDISLRHASDRKALKFSTLLPPGETSCSVVTHGFMHILSLATKGFLSVHQDDYKDLSTQYRARPSSQASKNALSTLRAALTAAEAGEPAASKRGEFQLEVTTAPPTTDQLRNILDYVGDAAGGRVTYSVSEVVNGARDAEDAIKRFKEGSGEGGFVRPITVDWTNGRAVVGDNESEILKMVQQLDVD